MRGVALGLGLLVVVVPAYGHASPLSDLAATVEPGTFVELEIDGSVTTCDAMVPRPLVDRSALGNILEFTDEALWDPTAREIYIMGERRPYQSDDKQFVRYSEATNSWTILARPPFNPGFHAYDHGAIDTVRRTYYRAMTGTPRFVWAMDLDSGVWRELPRLPLALPNQIIAIEFFPEIDGLAYFMSYYDDGVVSSYFRYSPADDGWERTALDAPFGQLSSFSEYNAARGVVYFGGGHHWTNGGMIPDPTPSINESRRLYTLDRDETVTRLADAPTYLGQGGSGPVQTIDPNSGNLVVFQGKSADHVPGTPCTDPLPIFEYGHDDDTWRQTGTQTLTDRWCSMNTAAVPLYDYGVIFIVNVRSDTSCRVLLYRHSPGTGPGFDAGVPGDAGAPGDGGGPRADAGARADAGTQPDAGDAEGPDSGGCQCGLGSVADTSSSSSWLLAMFAGLGFVVARRRSSPDGGDS